MDFEEDTESSSIFSDSTVSSSIFSDSTVSSSIFSDSTVSSMSQGMIDALDLCLSDITDDYQELIRKLKKSLKTMKEMNAKSKTIDIKSCMYLQKLNEVFVKNKDCRQRIGDELVSNNAVSLFLNYLRILTDQGKEYPHNDDSSIAYDGYCLILSVLWNYTDVSRQLCIELGKKKCLNMFMEDLKTLQTDLDDDDEKRNIASCVIAILQNCARVSENIKYFKQMDEAIPTIAWYARNTTKGFRSDTAILSMMLLSHIVDEKNNHLLDDQGIIEQLIDILSGAMTSDDHQYDGFSIKEVLLSLSHLAVNKNNSLAIVKQGILPTLYKLMEKGDDDEQLVATETIWSLSFENTPDIKSIPGLVEYLKVQVAGSTDVKLKGAASGALLVLEQMHKGENTLEALTEPKKYADLKKKSSFQSNTNLHVMISYSWRYQKKMTKVNERLKENGLKTWMDLEKMSGSTLNSMAKAVEKSAVVLVCLSQAYKESKFCRTEAEYAYEKCVPIIPIFVEEGYKPDEWLGAFVAGKKYFSFTSKSNFEENFSDLLQEIKSVAVDCDNKVPLKTTNKSLCCALL